MVKTIKFTANNVKSFSNWLKKFASIDNKLLLEVDEHLGKFIAKSYNEERSVVKFSKILFEDAGFSLNEKPKESSRIKVGIYNVPKLIKILDHFISGEFEFSFNYDEMAGEKKELAGILIFIKNNLLKVKLDCTSLSIFKYIPDDLFRDKIALLTPPTISNNFELSNITIEKINSLCDLDKESKFIDFKMRSSDKKVYVSGKTFELQIDEVLQDLESSITIYKEQFEKVDIENYIVNFFKDRLIFTSKDSDTIIVISMVEKDEKFDSTFSE